MCPGQVVDCPRRARAGASSWSGLDLVANPEKRPGPPDERRVGLRLRYLVWPRWRSSHDDFDRSVAFCRDDLGWPTEGIVGQEFHDEFTGAAGTIAIFTLDDGGLMLTLNERANLAKDASAPLGSPSSAEFSLGIQARSQAEVDDLLRHAGSRRRHADSTRPHAPVRGLLRVLHRSRWSPVRDRLEFRRGRNKVRSARMHREQAGTSLDTQPD